MKGGSSWVRGLLVSCAIGVLSACSGGLESTDSPEAATATAPLDADEIALAKTAATSTRPDTSWQPPSGTTPRNINYLYLQSDAGDPVGGSKRFLYTQANSLLNIQPAGPYLGVSVRGNEFWDANFQEPPFAQLKRGLFTNVGSWPPANEGDPGMSISGQGLGCGDQTGWFAVDEIEYEKGKLVAIVLRFAQTCAGATGSLRGKLRWAIGDRTAPPPPVFPPPANLWQPPAGSTPTTGTYVYLQGDAGDFILDNETRLFTQANALFSVGSSADPVTISWRNSESWNATFKAMYTLSQLKPGYYPDVTRYPFNNPAKGGLEVNGRARGCNALKGWFVVDAISFVNGTLVRFDARFEQHCEGATAALRGKIHWDANDPTHPPGPVNPPPASLWQPAAGATPASGNYIYLQSEPGDFVGQGATYTYTLANSLLFLGASPLNQLSVSATGAQRLSSRFQTMIFLQQLEPGYYADLPRDPFANPLAGSFEWAIDFRGCPASTSWVVIDSVTYANNALAAIDLRFEQRCDGASAALRGKVHWVAGDTTGGLGPVFPPPAALWDAPAGSTPASGNYVYLQSEPGDYIGQGLTYLYTAQDAAIGVGPSFFPSPFGHARVTVTGSKSWTGDFESMSPFPQLQPGYYGSLTRYLFHDRLKGGLDWTGDFRGCNTLTGWFVVDNVVYSSGVLTALDLRFEQHCEGAAPALHGKIHWVSGP